MTLAQSTIALALAASALALAAPGRAPNFECADATGTTYRAWLRPEGNRLHLVSKGSVREVKLGGANGAREIVLPGSAVVYNRWNFPAGKDVHELIDLSSEVSVQYLTEDGRTKVKVGFVVDDREALNVTCRTASFAVETVSAFDELPAAQRLASWIELSSQARNQKGMLRPMAEAAVAAALRRFFHSPDFQRDSEAFLAAIATPVKNLDPRTVEKVGKRLPPAAAEWWRGALLKLRYRYYPEVLRYATWIKEGTRPKPARDILSVIAGFREMTSSALFSDPEMKEYFINEVTASLKTIDDEESLAVSAGLGEKARAFFMERWQRAIGRRTVADVPELGEIALELKKLVEAKNFDPMPIQRKLSSFTKSPLMRQPDGPSLFLQAASAPLKKLTPRQREDVLGWLEGPERDLFLRMVPQQ